MENAAANLLSSLGGDKKSASVELPGGTKVVVSILEPEPGKPLSVPLEGTEAKIAIPSSTFDAVRAATGRRLEDKPITLAVTVFGDEMAENLGGSGMSNGVEVETAVSSAMTVDLGYLGGDKLSVKGLKEPIEVSLPVNRSRGMKCSYYDTEKQEWSTEGVRIDESAPDGQIKCLTTHLSLFGAIFQGLVNTILCSQLSLLNSEAMGEIFVGTWYTGIGAKILWVTLVIIAATFAFSAYLDQRYKVIHSWSAEFLLVAHIPTPESAKLVEHEKSGEKEKKEKLGGEQERESATTPATPASPVTPEVVVLRQGSKASGFSARTTESIQSKIGYMATLACLCTSTCSTSWQWCKESSSVREAIDDIISNWFANFGELRSALEGMCEGLELSSLMAPGRALTLSNRIMSHILMSSSRRQTCATLGISDSMVQFITQDEELRDYLVNAQEEERRKRAEARAAGGAAGGSVHRLIHRKKKEPEEEAVLQPHFSERPSFTSESQAPDQVNMPQEVPEVSRVETGESETVDVLGQFLAKEKAGPEALLQEEDRQRLQRVASKSSLTAAPETEDWPYPPRRISKVSFQLEERREDTWEPKKEEKEPEKKQPENKEPENKELDAEPEQDPAENPLTRSMSKESKKVVVMTPQEESSAKRAQGITESSSEEPEEPEEPGGPAEVKIDVAAQEDPGQQARCWKKTHDPKEAWQLLHAEVSHHIHGHVGRHSALHLPRTVCGLFLVQNPVGAALIFDIFTPCKLRALFFALEIMGSFMLSCLFFQVSGSTKKKGLSVGGAVDDMCSGGEYEDTVGYQIGRLLAVGTGSIFVAGIPVAFLESMHTRQFKKIEGEPGGAAWKRQLGAWKVQDRIIWTVGLAYLSFQTFFTVLFLANVSEDDQEDWMWTAFVTLIQDLFALPFFLAFLMPGIGGCLLTINSIWGKVERSALVRHAQEELHRHTNVMMPIVQI